MAYYDLPKEERRAKSMAIQMAVLGDIRKGVAGVGSSHYADEDTYIRKAAYLGTGRVWLAEEQLRPALLQWLESLYLSADPKIRQTVVNAAGEAGKTHFEAVQHFFDRGLQDSHHSVRNAVIGSVKKMGECNPLPVLAWAQTYLQHPDKEIRREICHGIELRGRKYPEDILPLLRQLEWDPTARVSNTLVHVLGQIAYKKGCLEKVLADLLHWENRPLVRKALEEIIDVHHRYRNFSYYTQDQARAIVAGSGL